MIYLMWALIESLNGAPMEHFLTLLQSAIELTARKAWIMLLFGGAMLGLVYKGLIPSSDILPGWYAFFAAITVLGVIGLVIALASTIRDHLAGKHSEHAAMAARQGDYDKAINAGVANLEVLSETETKYLVWILRQGKDRFRANFISYDGNNLQAKRILFLADDHARDIFQVNPGVWSDRENILKRYENLYIDTTSPPWERY
ncbi:MAG: hypothetical protein E5V59_18190 [Mesorhizobium sp.]|nr:MAG: hypothetical protein E5V59_18190 [Mesorhizobium sp.]